jgi:polyhydroxyalkanoate synthesis regulator phasin
MRSIHFSFKTGDNKSKTLRLTAYEGDLTQEAAKRFMQALVDADQFYNDKQVKQYAQPVAARAIDTESEDIFVNEL